MDETTEEERETDSTTKEELQWENNEQDEDEESGENEKENHFPTLDMEKQENKSPVSIDEGASMQGFVTEDVMQNGGPSNTRVSANTINVTHVSSDTTPLPLPGYPKKLMNVVPQKSEFNTNDLQKQTMQKPDTDPSSSSADTIDEKEQSLQDESISPSVMEIVEKTDNKIEMPNEKDAEESNEDVLEVEENDDGDEQKLQTKKSNQLNAQDPETIPDKANSSKENNNNLETNEAGDQPQLIGEEMSNSDNVKVPQNPEYEKFNPKGGKGRVLENKDNLEAVGDEEVGEDALNSGWEKNEATQPKNSIGKNAQNETLVMLETVSNWKKNAEVIQEYENEPLFKSVKSHLSSLKDDKQVQNEKHMSTGGNSPVISLSTEIKEKNTAEEETASNIGNEECIDSIENDSDTSNRSPHHCLFYSEFFNTCQKGKHYYPKEDIEKELKCRSKQYKPICEYTKKKLVEKDGHSTLTCDLKDCATGSLKLGSFNLDTGHFVYQKLNTTTTSQILETLIETERRWQKLRGGQKKRRIAPFVFLNCKAKRFLGNRKIRQILTFPLVSKPLKGRPDFVKENTQKGESDPININIVVIDSLSRQHFYRVLPKTAAALKSINHRSNTLTKALDFKGMQSLAPFTYVNIHALMNGTIDNTNQKKNSKRREYPIQKLFAAFKMKGYETMLQEDSCWHDKWGSLLTGNEKLKDPPSSSSSSSSTGRKQELWRDIQDTVLRWGIIFINVFFLSI